MALRHRQQQQREEEEGDGWGRPPEYLLTPAKTDAVVQQQQPPPPPPSRSYAHGANAHRRTLIDSMVTRDDSYWPNRVELYFEVPFGDHAHIIGHEGVNTKDVMKTTSCRVHFPDQNKFADPRNKCNTVLIAGLSANAELVRSSLRGLAPIQLCFGLKGARPDVTVDDLMRLVGGGTGERPLNVTVLSQRDSADFICVVEGDACQTAQIVTASHSICQHLFAPATPITFRTEVHVLADHVATVIGPSERQVQWVMQQTGVQIDFHSPAIVAARKWPVAYFHLSAADPAAVLRARQCLLGLHPVRLCFVIRRETTLTTPPNIPLISRQFNVDIEVARRQSRGMCSDESVTIRTLECNLSAAFRAREQIVRVADQTTTACNDYDFMQELLVEVLSDIPSPTEVASSAAVSSRIHKPPSLLSLPLLAAPFAVASAPPSVTIRTQECNLSTACRARELIVRVADQRTTASHDYDFTEELVTPVLSALPSPTVDSAAATVGSSSEATGQQPSPMAVPIARPSALPPSSSSSTLNEIESHLLQQMILSRPSTSWSETVAMMQATLGTDAAAASSISVSSSSPYPPPSSASSSSSSPQQSSSPVSFAAPVHRSRMAHGRSIYVGNLPFQTTEDDLASFLAQAGPVANVRLVKDRETGRPKGIGFGQFENEQTAQKAISTLDGAKYKGRSIRVNWTSK